MSKLKKIIFINSLLFIALGVFTGGWASEQEEKRPLNRAFSGVQSENLGWSRLKEIGKIWGKNALQTVDLFGCLDECYERLPVVSRDTRAPIIYIEDRFGYALAPLNWLYYINEEHLPSEGPSTMYVRGMLKKYNEAVRSLLLPNDHTQ